MIIKLLIAGREDNNSAENIRHLLYVFAYNKLPTNHLPTEFTTFITQRLNADQNIELHIANCLGQEQFPNILSTSFQPNATNAFVLVCAENNLNSLRDIRKKWYPKILSSNRCSPTILVCLKSEPHHKINENEPAQISFAQNARQLAKDMGTEYIECNSQNIDEIMSILDKIVTICIEQEYSFSHNDLISKMSLVNRLSRSSSFPEIASDNSALVPPGSSGDTPAAQTEEAHETEFSSDSEISENDNTPRMRR